MSFSHDRVHVFIKIYCTGSNKHVEVLHKLFDHRIIKTQKISKSRPTPKKKGIFFAPLGGGVPRWRQPDSPSPLYTPDYIPTMAWEFEIWNFRGFQDWEPPENLQLKGFGIFRFPLVRRFN